MEFSLEFKERFIGLCNAIKYSGSNLKLNKFEKYYNDDDNLIGIKNELNEIILPSIYNDIIGFKNGFFYVELNDKYFWINKDQIKIIEIFA